MKKMWILLSFTIAFSLPGGAMAQIMQTQPVSAILKILRSAGYIGIQRVELMGQQYQVAALDGDGEPVSIQLNATSGDIVAMKKIDAHIPISEVVQKVEGVGYGGITLIAAQENCYKIVALDPQGKTITLRVDARSGVLTKME